MRRERSTTSLDPAHTRPTRAPGHRDRGHLWRLRAAHRATVRTTSNAGRVPWLTLVWSDPHWRLFEVAEYVPIVDRPAELVAQGADRIVVRVPRPATVSIRYAYTDRLSISGGACVTAGADGRIVAHLPEPGVYALLVGWGDGDHACDAHVAVGTG